MPKGGPAGRRGGILAKNNYSYRKYQRELKKKKKKEEKAQRKLDKKNAELSGNPEAAPEEPSGEDMAEPT